MLGKVFTDLEYAEDPVLLASADETEVLNHWFTWIARCGLNVASNEWKILLMVGYTVAQLDVWKIGDC